MVRSLFAVNGLLMYMTAPDSKPSASASPPPFAVRKITGMSLRRGARRGGSSRRGTASVEADARGAGPHAVDFRVVIRAAGAGRGDDGVEPAVAAAEDARVAVRPVRGAVGDGGAVRAVAGGAVEVHAAADRRGVPPTGALDGDAVALDEV